MKELITGNLFQQKTKVKCVDGYLPTAFHYIHQNPLKARLVRRLEDYKWSSLQEYLGNNLDGICDKEIANLYLDVRRERLVEESYWALPEELISEVL